MCVVDCLFFIIDELVSFFLLDKDIIYKKILKLGFLKILIENLEFSVYWGYFGLELFCRVSSDFLKKGKFGNLGLVLVIFRELLLFLG